MSVMDFARATFMVTVGIGVGLIGATIFGFFSLFAFRLIMGH